MAQQFSIGDKVKFRREFLQSTGQYTGDVPFAKGVVREVKDMSDDRQIVTVEWDLLDTGKVLNSNLVLQGSPESS